VIGPLIARLAASIVAGLTLGAGFFALLRLTVRLYAGPRWPIAIVLHLTRWAFLAAALVVAARAGALPLLAMTTGVLAARSLLMRRARQERP
jgi:F1F0 ATPase subunit 2